MYIIPNRYHLTIFAIFLAIGYLVLGVSLYLDFYHNGFSEGTHYFMRSGSMLIFIAVIVEYWLNKRIVAKAATSVKVEGKTPLVGREFSVVERILHWISIWSIALGTFIWGYGDLIIENYFL